MYNPGSCTSLYIDTLRVALSSSFIKTKSVADLLGYVSEVLNIPPWKITKTINDSENKLFELDLSNTTLKPSDIDSIPELDTPLSWTILFADNDELHTSATELPIKFEGYDTLSTQAEIPAYIRVIDDYTFQDSPLEDIEFSENSKLTIIGEYAFADSKLKSITIPNSVTTIGSYAFYYCTSLTEIHIPNSVTTIGSYAFNYCQSLPSITIPNSVTTIGDFAFFYCRSLEEINLPNSVTTIGSKTFSFCTSLTEINIPNSVTTIGQSAFNDCQSLTSITIPNSVTTIGDCAFYDCISLKDINIPNSVTTIGLNAFYYCPLEVIKIDCQPKLKNNIVETLDKMTGKCPTNNLNTLQVSLSQALIDSFADTETLKAYVTEILVLENTTDNTIINVVKAKQGLKLDLSNTGLTQSDISYVNTLPNTLGWNINFD
jgi:hypothetical protein